MSNRPLRFKGGDVRLVRRLAASERVVVEYFRRGRPSGHEAEAWPHELTGHPGGLKAIKAMIAALADPAAPSPSPVPDAPPPRLHAHFAAAHEDREDDPSQ